MMCESQLEIAECGAKIRNDCGGAILVVAVFMSVCLVGAVWYIMGIADAIFYRERMQDAADAVAFASAVYHARGMNIIAMINIIMGAIVGVLVALKTLQLLNVIANVISCALAWLGIGAPLCAATSGLQGPIASMITAVQKVTDTVLPILSRTQVAIGAAMPIAAEAKAITIASSHYTPVVRTGGMVSLSLLPPFPNTNRLWGLPLEEDSYKNVCKRGMLVVEDLFFYPFRATKFLDWVEGISNGVVSTFPAFFCGDTGTDRPWVEGSVLKGQANEDCKAKKEETEKDKKNFDFDKCVGDTQKSLQAALDGTGKLPGRTGLGGMSKTPKAVYHLAENGNGFFQIWAVVKGNEQLVEGTKKGVEMAGLGKTSANPADYDVAFAQSEYYYDSGQVWSYPVNQNSSMWNMRWRARLRRFRPIDALVTIGSTWATSKAIGFVDGKIGAVLGKSKWGSFFLDTWKGNQLVYGNVNKYISPIPRNAINEVEVKVLGDQSFGYIH